MGGGLSSLTFPVLPGDSCVLLFNDRDLDNWFLSGLNTPVNTTRTHHFSDAIALVGIRSLPNVIKTFDPVRAVLSNGAAEVGVGPVLVKVANTAFTLNGLIQELITDIKTLASNVNALVTATESLTVICATPGSPSSVPVNLAAISAVAVSLTATTASLTATGLKFNGLIE